MKRAIPGRTKIAVASRVGALPGGTSVVQCFYCGKVGALWWPFTYTNRIGSHMVMTGFEFDHLFPESKGGAADPSNIVIACRSCNRAKKDKVLKCLASGQLSLSSGIAPERQEHRCARDCFS